MNILTIWLAVLFAFSFFAYLSFSLICEDVVAWALTPPEKEKEQEYSLPPLSVLFADVERLISVLSSSRLLFALPAILLAYYWSSHLGAWIAAAILAALIVLLYVIPQEFLSRTSLSPFKGTVQVFGYLFYPVYWIVAKLSPGKARSEILEREQRSTAEPHEEETEEFKGDIIKAISVIGETTVREVMTPRVDMVAVSSTATLAELHQLFKEHKFTRLAVYKERIDNVTGIVSMVDFIDCMPNYDLNAPVSDLMRPALYVPETKRVHTLLRELRESHVQMAIVIDEYGGTSGLVTLEDLLEEIVGEIEDEYDEAPFQSHREKDGAYIVTGKFPVEQLEEIFQVEIPAEDFETVSGLIFSVVGRIPLVGEVIRYKNLTLEILEADKRRIHRVRIKALPQEQNAEEPA